MSSALWYCRKMPPRDCQSPVVSITGCYKKRIMRIHWWFECKNCYTSYSKGNHYCKFCAVLKNSPDGWNQEGCREFVFEVLVNHCPRALCKVSAHLLVVECFQRIVWRVLDDQPKDWGMDWDSVCVALTLHDIVFGTVRVVTITLSNRHRNVRFHGILQLNPTLLE